MSKSALSTILLAASLALLGCKPKPNTETPEPKPGETQPGETDDGKPLAPSTGVIEINPLSTEVSVKLGATLHYSFKSHASVGVGAEAEIADPAVLELVRTDTAYEQSEAEREGKAGADAATGTFVIETRAVGTTTLTVRELFRGSVEREQTITVTVAPE